MKLRKQALVLGVLSTALGLVKAAGAGVRPKSSLLEDDNLAHQVGTQIHDVFHMKENPSELFASEPVVSSALVVSKRNEKQSELGDLDFILDDDEDCDFDIVNNAPARSPTMSPVTYDQITNGLCAIGTIDGYLNGIPDGNSPQEVMQTFAEIANIASVFVPQLAVVGLALGLIAGFMDGPTPPEQDESMKYFDNKFKELDNKLNRILNAIEEMKLELCKDKWDIWYDEYLLDWEESYNKYKNGSTELERKLGYEDLLQHCKDKPPYKYSARWNNIVMGNSNTFTNCFPEAVNSCKNRVLYFRKNFSSKILRNIYKAAEYEGLCNGFRAAESQAGSQIESLSPIAEHINNIYNKVLETDTNMYKMGKDFDSGKWMAAVKAVEDDNGANCVNKVDVNCIINALKTEFYQDFRYAVVGLKGDVREHSTWSYMDDSWRIKQWRSFFVDSSNGGVIVFLRSPIPLPANGGSASSEEPRATIGPSIQSMFIGHRGCMDICQKASTDIWGNYKCDDDFCDSTWRLSTNFKRTNSANYAQLSKRGVFIIRTSVDKQECLDDYYGCTRWSDWKAESGKSVQLLIPSANDNIIERFGYSDEKFYEGGWDGLSPQPDFKMRPSYSLIGISGEWPGLPRGSPCEENPECAQEMICMHGAIKGCGPYEAFAKPDPDRWGTSGILSMSNSTFTPEPVNEPLTEPLGEPVSSPESEPVSSPVAEPLPTEPTEAPCCDSGESIVKKILRAKSSEGEGTMSLKSMIQKVLM